MIDQAQITVTRTTSYPGRLRSYKVKIDGVILGQVRAGSSVTIPVSSGRHSISLRIDWCGSEPIDFEAKPGEHLYFEGGSNLVNGWGMLFPLLYAVFFPHRYLWLRRAAQSEVSAYRLSAGPD